MYLMNVSAVFADAPATPPPNNPSAFISLVPLMIIMIGFLFVSSRMQKKKAKEHDEKVKSLKSGDKVVTTSGIIATVITVKDDSISIRSADSKFEITKGAVAEIRERSGESSAS